MGNISHKAGCADGAGMIFPIHFGISVEFLVFLYAEAGSISFVDDMRDLDAEVRVEQEDTVWM